MKTRIITSDNAKDIIVQYWNEMGETISEKAKTELEDRIDMASIDVELTEDQLKALEA